MLGDKRGRLLNKYVADYVVFDLETTGISSKYDEVIEISAVKVEAGQVTGEFSTLVNPGRKIPPAASRVNGITDKMVAGALPFSEVLGDFFAFAGDFVLVGHNINSFDMKFLYRDAKKYFRKVPDNDYVDTLLLARAALPELSHHRLVDLAEHYGISAKGAHRALNDCHMNQKVYGKLAEEAEAARQRRQKGEQMPGSAGAQKGGQMPGSAGVQKDGQMPGSAGAQKDGQMPGTAGVQKGAPAPVHHTVKLRGVVERITYQNPENGYTVLKCAVKDDGNLVTVVGSLLDVNVGSVLLMDGNWRMDSRYGRQFAAETWEETLPATVYGIEKYLGSGLIKGVGPRFAQRIVRKFGTDTIEVIENEIGRLREVEGIGEKRILQIKESWERQKEIKNVMLFLQDHGVNTSFAAKIYRQYGNESIAKVKENPFCLADDIWGIGFKTADSIAEKLGFQKESFVRLRSGIMYTLSSLADEGHVYAGRDQLIRKAVQLLEAEESSIVMTLDQMIADKDVIREKITQTEPEASVQMYPEGREGQRADREENGTIDAIYLPPFYYAETGIADRLKRLAETPAQDRLWVQLMQARKQTGNPELSIDVSHIEKKIHMEYDEIQADAIRKAATSKVMILTGGPGTGKTTTVQGILAAYRAFGLKILLAAPTGRAAKRLEETTGMEAKTIHRLLEYKPPEGYQKNEEHPLEGDVLVVDECSMIDIILMNALLKAVPPGMRFVLVGDVDQLPSVGAGNVLRDMMDSGCFPVIRLTRIFRQAQTSRIVMNAHRINEGRLPDISNGNDADFFFIEKEEPEEAVAEIVNLVQQKLSRFYHTPVSQIQVLTPMQKGAVGAANLNLALQEALNPQGEGLRRSGFVYRMDDKVMQIKNNYDKEVFNGDIGFIESVDVGARTLKVSFDGRIVEYDASELDELVHAYATTIHKAQGSEYPIVVMPVLMNHYVMLQRNLIYTGITRAKKILVMVGTKKALAYAVRNVTVTKRNTLLKERLQDTMKRK
ncbi:ATP-dependent RecD-like DNA helicase [Marvinbryantia formatexigens]|uniref:SF1B family DNA helicase RecD2 n=1 Tax=Marvinbryantia formatexigens TaxID=168384 RepID=UPI0015A2E0A7|nr:ATP-dependent RecD-like DNA helicase [Marvinbryantia formatexigens]